MCCEEIENQYLETERDSSYSRLTIQSWMIRLVWFYMFRQSTLPVAPCSKLMCSHWGCSINVSPINALSSLSACENNGIRNRKQSKNLHTMTTLILLVCLPANREDGQKSAGITRKVSILISSSLTQTYTLVIVCLVLVELSQLTTSTSELLSVCVCVAAQIWKHLRH